MDPASVMRAAAATRAAGTARIRASAHSDGPLGEQFGLDLTGLADLLVGRARLEGPGIVIVRDADTHYGHPEGRGRWVRRRKRPSDLLESPLWLLDGRIDWSTSAGRLQARAPSVRAGWLQRVLAGPAGDAAAVDVEFATDEAGRIVHASFRGRPHEPPPNWGRMSEDERKSFTHAFGAFGRALAHDSALRLRGQHRDLSATRGAHPRGPKPALEMAQLKAQFLESSGPTWFRVRMRESLARLTAGLERRPPADPAALERAGRELGLALPEDYVEFTRPSLRVLRPRPRGS